MNKIILLTAITIGFWGCGGKGADQAAATATDSVEVFVLKKEPVVKNLSLPAELHPWERAEIYAKVEGYVKELKVDIGDRVKRNDVLVVLDAPEVSANYAKASADLQASHARYQTSLDNYERILNASQEKGAISDAELERSRNQMLTDSSFFEASKSSANAYAQLMNYLVIRATFDGVITQRNVDPGTLVGKTPRPMIVLENLSKLRLRIAIPETYTSALPESPNINFTVDAQPSKSYQATLARKSNLIDLKTRTELWEFEVSNKDSELKSGMFGNTTFNLKRSEPTFVVPYSAVITTLEKRFVIRASNGKVEWVDVLNGINTNDKMEIFGDLHEGDFLLIKPNDEIREGSILSHIKITGKD